MKRMILVLAAALLFNSAAFAADVQQKYAVVDVKKVIDSSVSVEKLKKDRQDQKEQVLKFVKESKEKVSAEKDSAKQEELKKKLNNDLKYMTTTFDKRYTDGLKSINDEISSDIAEVAKQKNYELILTTDSVLYGGENITKDIVKAVK